MSAPNNRRTKRTAPDAATEAILRHWREAVPNDRLAHLVKDATRGLLRALQMRLSKYGVAFGHWAFLRILWEQDGLTQRALSEGADGADHLLRAHDNGEARLHRRERRRTTQERASF